MVTFLRFGKMLIIATTVDAQILFGGVYMAQSTQKDNIAKIRPRKNYPLYCLRDGGTCFRTRLLTHPHPLVSNVENSGFASIESKEKSKTNKPDKFSVFIRNDNRVTYGNTLST